MMRDVIKALFVVAIMELTLVVVIMILFSTVTTVIKILMIALVFVSLAALIKELQDKVKAEKPGNHTPLRNYEWFL